MHLRRALAAEAEVRTRQQRDLFRPLEAYHASLGFYLLATLSACGLELELKPRALHRERLLRRADLTLAPTGDHGERRVPSHRPREVWAP